MVKNNFLLRQQWPGGGERCRAQLNSTGKQSHVDIHLKEHQRRSYESGRAQWTRANTPHCPLMAELSCSTITSRYERHERGVRGWQQAASESDNMTYPCHMARQKTICTGWPVAALSTPSPASLALSGYRCVIRIHSHSGALIGPTGINTGWHRAPRATGHSVAAHSHIIRLWLWYDMGRDQQSDSSLSTTFWLNWWHYLIMHMHQGIKFE